MKNNGFIYVASKYEEFIQAARFSATSLKDYWHDANITLFTHKEWLQETDSNLLKILQIKNDLTQQTQAPGLV